MVLQSCPVVSGPAGVCKQKGPTNVTSLSVGLVYFGNPRLNQAIHASILLVKASTISILALVRPQYAPAFPNTGR